MKELKFEFDYHTKFEELDVRTESLTVILVKGDPENIKVSGEMVLQHDINYEMFDDKIITFKSSEKRMSIDTSDFEDDLAEKGIDMENSKLFIIVPDELKIRVESEMGRIRVEHIKADAIIYSEIGSIFLDDVSGNFKINSEIGSVHLIDGCFDNLSCSTEVGNINIDGIKSHSLMCETEVGKINIKEAEVSDVTISSETGNIEYHLLPIKQNQTKISAEIGKVKIIIPPEVNLDLQATSEIGTVNSLLKNVITKQIDNGIIVKTDDETNGKGRAKILASTEIGSITLLNEDSQSEEKSSEFKHNKFNREYDKAMNEIDRATKAFGSPAFRRSLGGAFLNLGEVIKTSVQSALKDADTTVKESLKGMKADLKQQREDLKSGNVRNQQEAQPNNSSNNSRFKPEERLSDNEKSRLKILDLLEAGKINHEEAEKLLKAINK